MAIGILASLLAGALWGLAFFAPLLTAPYAPFDLTIGRYLVFGLTSLALLAAGGFSTLRCLRWRDWILVVVLGFAGNVGYYLAVALAVPRAGTAVVAMIVGCLPVVMALADNRVHQQVPLRQLLSSLTLITAGLVAVNGTALIQAHIAGAFGPFLFGVLLTFAAVALWAWYGLRNARVLSQFPALSSAKWTALTGVGTLLALLPALIIGWLAGWSTVPAFGLSGPAASRLLLWSLVLGIMSSWAGTWAWSIATRHLSVSLASQLIVFETVFALLYGAVYQSRLPDWPEALGGTLLILGIVMALRTFARFAPNIVE